QGQAFREKLLGTQVEPGDGRSRDEAERDDRRARAEAALARDPVDECKALALDRRKSCERPDSQMVAVGESVPVGYLELVPEIERDRGAVVARPDVCRRRRSADADGAHRDAASIASGSGSTGTGSGLSRAAVSGSFSPCPVITHTTVERGSSSIASSAAS